MSPINLSGAEALAILSALEAAETVIDLILRHENDEAERKAADARIDVGDAIPLLQSKLWFGDDHP